LLQARGGIPAFSPSPPVSAQNSIVPGLIAHSKAFIGSRRRTLLKRQNAIIGPHLLGKCARRFESELRHSFLIQAQSI